MKCGRKLDWCMGHRVVGHEGKCANPHGHQYQARVTAEIDELDVLGRVVDFSVLKERVGGWIDEHWDHGFLLKTDDHAMKAALLAFRGSADFKPKAYMLPLNPTAENIADYLLRVVCPEVLEGTGVVVTSVIVWETTNCWAEARL